ncbi:TPA: kinase [Streptococcus suis]
MNKDIFEFYDQDNYSLPDFGFKIHISATPGNYKTIFNIVYPILCERQLIFKYIKKEPDILSNFSESESAPESGKFFTIYPQDREHCLSILDMLYLLLPKELEGIHILSDRAYKDSNIIFYRFGCIIDREENRIEGHPAYRHSDGRFWLDYQKSYFDLPEWVEDLQEQQIITASYLSSNYDVKELLKASNAGNIYLAQNKQGEQVIIKESRPHIVCHHGITNRQLREQEWKISSENFPDKTYAIEVVNEWKNRYYIYRYIEGQSLLHIGNEFGIFSYSSKDTKGNFLKYQKLSQYIRQLLLLVKSLHNKGIVLNDIHPNNFIVTKNDIHFVDLENSYIYGTQPLLGIFHAVALQEWNELDGKLADCRKIGNMILYLFGRLQHTNDKDSKEGILTKLLARYGIKTDIEKVIQYLLKENCTIDEACAMVNSLISIKNDEHYSLNPQYARLKRALTLSELISEYSKQDHVLHHPDKLQQWIEQEAALGLDGVGSLILYLNQFDPTHKLIHLGVNRILQALIPIDNGIGLPIDSQHVSPYVKNGSSGVIRLLLYLDKQRYKDTIKKLVQSLQFEYAQYSDYHNGMLGIVDTLLVVYEELGYIDCLTRAESMLKNAAIVLDNETDKTELSYVLGHYFQVLNDKQQR